jgi:hypothetical protein
MFRMRLNWTNIQNPFQFASKCYKISDSSLPRRGVWEGIWMIPGQRCPFSIGFISWRQIFSIRSRTFSVMKISFRDYFSDCISILSEECVDIKRSECRCCAEIFRTTISQRPFQGSSISRLSLIRNVSVIHTGPQQPSRQDFDPSGCQNRWWPLVWNWMHCQENSRKVLNQIEFPQLWVQILFPRFFIVWVMFLH